MTPEDRMAIRSRLGTAYLAIQKDFLDLLDPRETSREGQ